MRMKRANFFVPPLLSPANIKENWKMLAWEIKFGTEGEWMAKFCLKYVVISFERYFFFEEQSPVLELKPKWRFFLANRYGIFRGTNGADNHSYCICCYTVWMRVWWCLDIARRYVCVMWVRMCVCALRSVQTEKHLKSCCDTIFWELCGDVTTNFVSQLFYNRSLLFGLLIGHWKCFSLPLHFCCYPVSFHFRSLFLFLGALFYTILLACANQ